MREEQTEEIFVRRAYDDPPSVDLARQMCHDALCDIHLQIRVIEHRHGIGREDSALSDDAWHRINHILGGRFDDRD